MGLSSYYRRFIKEYAQLSHPLVFMLKGNKKFDTTLILALPNFHLDFMIKTDTSRIGIRVILMQNSHPIAYISKVLSNKHQAMPAYDEEMYAILFVVKKWQQ